jgi:eukaryotic-like serine/threonine-protein kinase
VASESGGTSFDIWMTTLADKKARPLVQSPFAEAGARVSPDGRFIAYVSNETGRMEEYVMSPDGGSKQQVSGSGGSEPVWTSRGTELVYRVGDQFMSVAVAPGPGLRLGTPRPLFSGTYARLAWPEPNYDVSPDGRHFLMVKGNQASLPTHLTLVMNWHK